MTVPVPGLSDERLTEIRRRHDDNIPCRTENDECALLVEVVRLREERDKAQRRINRAQDWHMRGSPSVLAFSCQCLGCEMVRIVKGDAVLSSDLALAIEDGQT